MDDDAGNVSRSPGPGLDVWSITIRLNAGIIRRFRRVKKEPPNCFLSNLCNLRNLRIILLFIFLPTVAAAQAPSPTPAPADQPAPQKAMRDPVENADDYKSKLTFGVYFTKDSQAYDLNLRHQFGPSVTAWIAGYADSTGSELLRIGGQYDYHQKWFHFVPSGEIETTKGASLSLYSELGYKTIAM